MDSTAAPQTFDDEQAVEEPPPLIRRHCLTRQETDFFAEGDALFAGVPSAPAHLPPEPREQWPVMTTTQYAPMSFAKTEQRDAGLVKNIRQGIDYFHANMSDLSQTARDRVLELKKDLFTALGVSTEEATMDPEVFRACVGLGVARKFAPELSANPDPAVRRIGIVVGIPFKQETELEPKLRMDVRHALILMVDANDHVFVASIPTSSPLMKEMRHVHHGEHIPEAQAEVDRNSTDSSCKTRCTDLCEALGDAVTDKAHELAQSIVAKISSALALVDLSVSPTATDALPLKAPTDAIQPVEVPQDAVEASCGKMLRFGKRCREEVDTHLPMYKLHREQSHQFRNIVANPLTRALDLLA